MPSADPMGDAIARLMGVALVIVLALVALPLVVPFLANAMVSDIVATRTRFWMVLKWHWLANLIGILLVTALVGVEVWILVGWIESGQVKLFLVGGWASQMLPTFGPWASVNLVSGVLLLPIVWSLRRRRIAEQVRSRRITDVLR